jgi:tetratricopeptide (TPR) repeat protein
MHNGNAAASETPSTTATAETVNAGNHVNSTAETSVISLDSKQQVRITAEEWKRRGNDHFYRNELREAILCYTRGLEAVDERVVQQQQQQQIDGGVKGALKEEDELRAILQANRSAARLAAGETRAAIEDAAEAVRLRPSWARAYLRLGNAYAQACQFPNARICYEKGLQLEPDSQELLQASRSLPRKFRDLPPPLAPSPLDPELFPLHWESLPLERLRPAAQRLVDLYLRRASALPPRRVLRALQVTLELHSSPKLQPLLQQAGLLQACLLCLEAHCCSSTSSSPSTASEAGAAAAPAAAVAHSYSSSLSAGGGGEAEVQGELALHACALLCQLVREPGDAEQVLACGGAPGAGWRLLLGLLQRVQPSVLLLDQLLSLLNNLLLLAVLRVSAPRRRQQRQALREALAAERAAGLEALLGAVARAVASPDCAAVPPGVLHLLACLPALMQELDLDLPAPSSSSSSAADAAPACAGGWAAAAGGGTEGTRRLAREVLRALARRARICAELPELRRLALQCLLGLVGAEPALAEAGGAVEVAVSELRLVEARQQGALSSREALAVAMLARVAWCAPDALRARLHRRYRLLDLLAPFALAPAAPPASLTGSAAREIAAFGRSQALLALAGLLPEGPQDAATAQALAEEPQAATLARLLPRLLLERLPALFEPAHALRLLADEAAAVASASAAPSGTVVSTLVVRTTLAEADSAADRASDELGFSCLLLQRLAVCRAFLRPPRGGSSEALSAGVARLACSLLELAARMSPGWWFRAALLETLQRLLEAACARPSARPPPFAGALLEEIRRATGGSGSSSSSLSYSPLLANLRNEAPRLAELLDRVLDSSQSTTTTTTTTAAAAELSPSQQSNGQPLAPSNGAGWWWLREPELLIHWDAFGPLRTGVFGRVRPLAPVASVFSADASTHACQPPISSGQVSQGAFSSSGSPAEAGWGTLATLPPEVCSLCGTHLPPAALKLCGGCKRAAYCGRECQAAHWRAGHKLTCKGGARPK